ncbi:cobalt ABC transporter ATP-binding protein [Campylobacterota bacterium]|nr:cobalt ABC transporter ATP-binding protein [Campylobacterota bacterium]
MSCTLKMKNVAISRDGNMIAKPIDITIAHKEKIAVIGHNGSGKTTLLETIVGLNHFDEGEIEIFHQRLISADNFAEARKKIGYLLQDADDHFLSPIVEDDVAFSLLSHGCDRQIAREKTAEILERLNISKLSQKIVYSLSGGEKKLVALAGILVCDPLLLLLDEPTAALDYPAQINLVEILRNLDISMVIVSHDQSFLERVAQRFYMLNGNGLREIEGFGDFITHSHDHLPPHTHY